MRSIFLALLLVGCGNDAAQKFVDKGQPKRDEVAPVQEAAKPADAATTVAAAETTATPTPTPVPAAPKMREASPIGMYVQATDQYIGTALDALGTVRFDDGTLARFTAHGAPNSSWVVSEESEDFVESSCSFTSGDCTGNCYVIGLHSNNDHILPLIKNTLYYTDKRWLRATGGEDEVTDLKLQSYLVPGGKCAALNWTVASARLLTNEYTLEQSPEMPFVLFGALYYK